MSSTKRIFRLPPAGPAGAESATGNRSLGLLGVGLALILTLTAGCASVPGPKDPRDPFEGFNRSMYKFNDAIDRGFLKPVAKGYQAITPDAVDKGVTNVFSNLGDVWVIANDLLQFKFGQALSDTGRFLINSTIGIYGIFDVATHIGLKKHNEDFGQTLGHWGVGPGPYLVLPILGPSTVRDTTGLVVETTQWNKYDEVADDNDEENLLIFIDTIDRRADLLSASRVLDKVALDPYIFLRESYLQKRAALVRDGKPPEEDPLNDDDLFEDDDDS